MKRVVDEIAGTDMHDFFERYVDGTEDLHWRRCSMRSASTRTSVRRAARMTEAAKRPPDRCLHAGSAPSSATTSHC
jgi:hypothetical protein